MYLYILHYSSILGVAFHLTRRETPLYCTLVVHAGNGLLFAIPGRGT